jgi:hypothetical protein
VRSLPVIYGVERPVRDMAFGSPVPLLSFTLSRIAVRVADFAGDTRLVSDIDAAADHPDPDAITVKHRPMPPQQRWPAILIGRDLLGRCPAITLYREGAVGLSCRP